MKSLVVMQLDPKKGACRIKDDLLDENDINECPCLPHS
jgi:hypothetical protein